MMCLYLAGNVGPVQRCEWKPVGTAVFLDATQWCRYHRCHDSLELLQDSAGISS